MVVRAAAKTRQVMEIAQTLVNAIVEIHLIHQVTVEIAAAEEEIAADRLLLIEV